jgi:integrase
MKFYHVPRSPYWYADLRRYGLGRITTGITHRGLAEKAIIKYLASKNAAPKTSRGTLLELITRHLIYSQSHNAAAVYIRDKHTLDRFLAFCGDKPLLEIQPSLIEDFKQMRCRDTIQIGRRIKGQEPEMQPIKSATINRDLTTIRRMFNLALDWALLDESPCRRVKPFKEPKRLPRPYEPKEIAAILKASPIHWRWVWLLFLNTGMRRGEGIGIKKADIRADGIWLYHTKELKWKVLPITDEMRRIIKKLAARSDNDYLLWFRDPRFISRTFKRLAVSAGVGGNLHRLRHTTGTYLIARGVPITEVQKFLGHADIRTTQRYAGSLDIRIVAALNEIRFDKLDKQTGRRKS